MQPARALWYCLMLFAMIALSGCGGVPAGETTIWIDAPLPGGQVNPGDEVQIQTHAYASGGVAEIELVVDGTPFSRNAPDPTGGDLVTLSQSWVATTPGLHSLQVTAYSSAGTPSSPAAVMIEVLGEQPPLQIPTAQATAGTSTVEAPTRTPTETPTLTPTLPVTVTPTITVASPTPTATSTTVPPPSIAFFTVDDDSLDAGDCTSLHWQVLRADSVTLDGSSVGSDGSRQVCPQQTTSYTLRAFSAGGERYQTVQVRVSIPPPADTSGPVISNLGVNPGKIFDNPSCGTDRALVSASVTDKGSGVRRVEIFFKVVKSGNITQSGNLASSFMSGSESQGYYWYLDSAELTRSMALWGGGTVQYYLVATDNLGNSTQSPTYTFQTETCIL